MDTETTTQVATVAVWVAWLTGGTLCLAVLGAACEAVIPGSMHLVGVLGVQGLYGALRLITLVSVVALAWRLLVTYVHTYRSDLNDGRHYPGFGRLAQGPGRHRAA